VVFVTCLFDFLLPFFLGFGLGSFGAFEFDKNCALVSEQRDIGYSWCEPHHLQHLSVPGAAWVIVVQE
jgi:hypothetical protein